MSGKAEFRTGEKVACPECKSEVILVEGASIPKHKRRGRMTRKLVVCGASYHYYSTILELQGRAP